VIDHNKKPPEEGRLFLFTIAAGNAYVPADP